MEPSTTNALISDHMMKALCNTLMHSLWQGIVLAAISGAIVIFTKKAKATYRYNLLVSALALFAIGVTVTFIMQLQKPADTGINTLTYVTAADAHGVHANTVYPTGAVPGAVTAPNSSVKQTGIADMFQSAVNYFNAQQCCLA